MREIKSKPGVYKEINFRSQLEIRWAEFFDDFGLKYQYEPKRVFFNDSTSYLPDFYLPEVWFVDKKWDYSAGKRGLWLEVKNPIKCIKNGEFDDSCEPYEQLKKLIEHESSCKPHLEEPWNVDVYGPAGTIVWFYPWFLGQIHVPVYRSFRDGREDDMPWLMDHDFRRCEECSEVSFSRGYAVELFGMVHKNSCSKYNSTDYLLEGEA